MEKEFVPYELAVKLKALGFDEPCFGYYRGNLELILKSDYSPWINSERTLIDSNFCTAPTYSQAFRWFREKYDLQCWSEPTGSDRYSCRYDGNDETGRRWVGYLRNNNKEILFHPTYEEAELACLRKLIQIVNSHKLPDLTWKDASEEEIKSKVLKSMKGKRL